MKRGIPFNMSIIVKCALILAVALTSVRAQASGPDDQATPGFPVLFVENVGQLDPQIRFQARGQKGALSVTGDSLIYSLVSQETDAMPQVARIEVTFVDANPHPTLTGFDRVQTNISYLRGNDPARWHTNVPTWRGVRFEHLYPGIDLELGGGDGRLEQRLVAYPGADLGAMRLRVEGAKSLWVERGQLRATSSLGEVALPLPSIAGRALVHRPSIRALGERTFEVSFPLAALGALPDARLAATAQTAATYVLDYSTFLGGTTGVGVLTDEGYAIAVDSTGAVYVTGWTYCNDFFTSGSYDISHNGAQDVFVAKLSADGSTLEYATYLGGNSNEEGHAIAVDSAGSAYVTGWTSPGTFDLPTTSGAFDESHNGDRDVFVTKLNPSGSGLVYSTFIGGSASDQGHAIVVDGSGAAYVTGEVDSSDFPTTTNSYDGVWSNTDAFVVKLNPNGGDLAYATYLGGVQTDYGFGIAVNGLGNAYVTGYTGSSDFPTTPTAFDTVPDNGWETFVTILNPAGGGASDLLYSTYLGGELADYGTGIAVQPGGTHSEAYVTGHTWSSGFPTTTNAYDTVHNGDVDTFVVKLDPSGGGQNDLIYATFLGGSNADEPKDIAVDTGGAAYVVGSTESFDFPRTPDAYQSAHNGYSSNTDAFVTKVSQDGSTLAYSTFLGTVETSLHDEGHGIAVGDDGAIYVTGRTDGTAFPTTPGAHDTTHNGDWDIFVTKFRLLDKSIYLPLIARNL